MLVGRRKRFLDLVHEENHLVERHLQLLIYRVGIVLGLLSDSISLFKFAAV